MNKLEGMVASETADSKPLKTYDGRAILFFDAKNGREIYVYDYHGNIKIVVSENRPPTVLDRARVWVMERMRSRSNDSP